MQTYKIPTLTSTTPKNDQTKLLSAIKGVKGVQTAELHPDKHELAITVKAQQEPKRNDIEAAAKGAGFPLTPHKA